jgi:hypothetical protein
MPILINTKKCTSAQICTAFESYLAIFGQIAGKRCPNTGRWTPDTAIWRPILSLHLLLNVPGLPLTSNTILRPLFNVPRLPQRPILVHCCNDGWMYGVDARKMARRLVSSCIRKSRPRFGMHQPSHQKLHQMYQQNTHHQWLMRWYRQWTNNASVSQRHIKPAPPPTQTQQPSPTNMSPTGTAKISRIPQSTL